MNRAEHTVIIVLRAFRLPKCSNGDSGLDYVFKLIYIATKLSLQVNHFQDGTCTIIRKVIIDIMCSK